MPQQPQTLEEAREMLLQNNETISGLTSERDTLTQQNQELANQIEELRTLNQKLYLRASQGTEEPQKEEPEPEPLEEFALKLKGVL